MSFLLPEWTAGVESSELCGPGGGEELEVILYPKGGAGANDWH